MPNHNQILIAQTEIGSFLDKYDSEKPGFTRFSMYDPAQSIFGQIDYIFSTIIGFLTIIAGLAFLIYFILGALNWVTAGGNEKKVEDAKSYMTNGAIGMIIIVASYSIIWIVGNVLGLDILNPSTTLLKIFQK